VIAALPAALPARNDFGDTMSDGLAGPMGLFIIVMLVVATVLLIRNMNARLRRLPERFPQAPDDQTGAADQPAPGAEAVPDRQPSALGQASLDEQAGTDATRKSSPA
jgi:hypothetical protein